MANDEENKAVEGEMNTTPAIEKTDTEATVTGDTTDTETTATVDTTTPATEATEEENVPAANAPATEETPAKAETVQETEEAPTTDRPGFVNPTREEDEDFDWVKYEEGVDAYSETDRQNFNTLYEDTLTSIAEKTVIQGTVYGITKKEVVVNIGYKSEGIIQINEFRYNPDLAVGEEVDVYVEAQEDRYGQMVISHKTARIHRAWERVNEALEQNLIIMGHVKCRTKGGLIVDVFGIEAFLPGSQIDVKPIRDYDLYVGKNMEFKVVKINHEFKNVVVSHKALIEAELEEQKKQIIGGLEKGQVLEGTVKNITSYGVFIDLGGVDGLIHITDLSWGRINHPEEVVQLDQKLNVVILDFDDNKKRIALGLKQLQSHPWDSLDEKLAVGDNVKGKVVVLADYGAFIEIASGVEGLIHVSEMSWSQHLRSAQDFLKVGDEVDAIVLTLDREERKMSLGMKQLMPDPWESILEKYPKESKHKATVRNFTNFGVFVEMEEGVDGLIHISDLSWSKKIKHPSEFCKVGDELDVIVLDVDKENRRLSLGHKQLEENPWDVFEGVFTVGSSHQGTIIERNDKNSVISLPYGVEGYCSAKHLRKADGAGAKMDDTLDFVVLEFNKEAKKIVVSHTRTFENDTRSGTATTNTGGAAKKRAQGSSGASHAVKALNKKQERTTLGDLSVLASLKKDMEKTENDPTDVATAKTPVAKETLATPAPAVTEKPVTEEPVTEKPVAEEPVTEKPVTEEPVAKTTTEQESSEDKETGEQSSDKEK